MNDIDIAADGDDEEEVMDGAEVLEEVSTSH
jgi:hypothetical protein